MQAINTTQPSKTCRKPSAWPMPWRSTSQPIAAMRSAFIMHRERHRGQQQRQPVPDRPAVEEAEDVGEAHDREEVAQPGAGLGHLQLVDPEVDDVAVEEDRHAHQPQHVDAELGGDQLQRGADLPVEHLRQRQHEDEVQNRRPEHPAAAEAEAGEDQPGGPDDQRVEYQVVDLHQVAEGGEPERQHDHRHARSSGRSPARAPAAPPGSRAGTGRTRGAGSPGRGCTRAAPISRRGRRARTRTAAAPRGSPARTRTAPSRTRPDRREGRPPPSPAPRSACPQPLDLYRTVHHRGHAVAGAHSSGCAGGRREGCRSAGKPPGGSPSAGPLSGWRSCDRAR